MKNIDYLNKDDRKINGMFYIENYNFTLEKFISVIFNPNHNLVLPVFDYIRDQSNNYENSNVKLVII